MIKFPACVLTKWDQHLGNVIVTLAVSAAADVLLQMIIFIDKCPLKETCLYGCMVHAHEKPGPVKL